MIDLEKETLIPLTEVHRHVPRRRQGKRLHHATVWRWWRKGVRGVHLEVIVIGGSPVTTKAALGTFFAAVAQAKAPEATAIAMRTPGQRQRAAKRAARELEAMGV